MKIAEISSTFPPYLAGTGNVCYQNSIGLANLGHEVTVYTSNYPKGSFNYPKKITVKRLNYLFRIGNAPCLLQLCTLKKFDIIHLHYPCFFGAEFIYFNHLLRKSKYVITYQNDVISEGVRGLFFRIHKNTLMKLILNRAEKIVVSSLDYSNNSFLSEMCDKNPEKIVEIPNGVDVNKFNPTNDGSRIKIKYGIEDKKIILFVGALDKPHFFKGVDVLLESFKKIANPKYHMLIVGDGDLKEDYLAHAKNSSIDSQVTFAGRVSEEDLPFYYAASDVTVLPSTTMGEAFGLVLLEAMATGKPVIASNLPGVRSVVDDGKNGYLVKPGDSDDLAYKIDSILQNESVGSKFGLNGRNKVEEKYEWGCISKIIEKEFSKIKA
jgi:glycosyltransferase involved in cell wall biosynthesis